MSKIKRSYEMYLVGYFLSRCADKQEDGPARPPDSLQVATWNDVYDYFFDVIGDGRQPRQFRGSLRAVRDTFDLIFDNGRKGWHDKNGNQSRNRIAVEIHELWERRSDRELEDFVFDLASKQIIRAH